MKTLNVSISNLEYDKFGIKRDKMTFTDFMDLVSREIMKQTLNKCIELAEKYGISRMSMAEITKEVKFARENTKNHNLHKYFICQ